MSERKTIYLCLAHMSEDGIEQKYVKEAFDTNWVVPLGPNVNGFEADLEKFVNETDPHVADAPQDDRTPTRSIVTQTPPEVNFQSWILPEMSVTSMRHTLTWGYWAM